MHTVIVKKSSPKNLSADCWSTVGRQVTDSLPTANQQVTDRLRKKKNGLKTGSSSQLPMHTLYLLHHSPPLCKAPLFSTVTWLELKN